MRVLVAINRLCYASCLLSIIVGAFLAVIAIWTEQEDVGWKGVATAAVLIFASILVIITNALIGSKVLEEDGGFASLSPSRFASQPPANRGAPAHPSGSIRDQDGPEDSSEE